MRKTKTYTTQKSVIKHYNNNIHIALLYGGMSAEREVSLMSAKDLERTLLELGYTVTPIDMGNDIAPVLCELRPDLVFNGLYGTHGEDGCLPGMLEMLDIKYTHSGVLASATGFNKEASYKVFNDKKLQCPKYKIIEKKDKVNKDPIKRPYVIKPLCEGSSIGVILVFEDDDFEFHKYNWPYGDRIIVEEYIPGKEIQVAVFNNKAIDAIEIIPLKNRFYDYETKYTANMADHVMPIHINENDKFKMLLIAEQAHNAIGAKTLSRVDFRYNSNKAKNNIYLLEINTHPGMTPFSLVPEICAYHHITFRDIVNQLVQDAL